MKLVDFYKNIITSVGLTDKNGDIFVTDDIAVTNEDGLPIVLPTKENINSIMSPKGEVTKIIYNPMVEDIYTKKNSNISLKQTIKMAELTLLNSILHIGELLMLATEDTTGNFKLNDFYSRVAQSTKKLTNVKKMVDDQSVDMWNNILAKALEDPNYKVVSFNQVKAGKIGKDMFNHVTNVYSPLLDHVLELIETQEKVTEILGVKVRSKDVEMVKVILTFLLNGVLEEDKKVISFGSNNEYGKLETFLTLYITLADYFNEISEALEDLDKDIYLKCVIDLKIKLEDLDHLPQLKKTAITLPSERLLSGVKEESTGTSIQDRLKSRKPTVDTTPGGLFAKYNAREELPVEDDRYETRRNEVEPRNSTFGSLMSKITGRHVEDDRDVPSVRNYNGPRPDLHVSRIYDEAPRYHREVYNPTRQNSRLSDNDSYVPASERNRSYGSSMYNRGGSYREEPLRKYGSREPELKRYGR